MSAGYGCHQLTNDQLLFRPRRSPPLLGHELHVQAGKAQFHGDLPVAEVEAHEIQAQFQTHTA